MREGRISKGRGWMRLNPGSGAIEWQNKPSAEPVDITDLVLALAAAWLINDSPNDPEGAWVDLDWPEGTPFACLSATPAPNPSTSSTPDREQATDAPSP
jgi:hypothetical protein